MTVLIMALSNLKVLKSVICLPFEYEPRCMVWAEKRLGLRCQRIVLFEGPRIWARGCTAQHMELDQWALVQLDYGHDWLDYKGLCKLLPKVETKDEDCALHPVFKAKLRNSSQKVDPYPACISSARGSWHFSNNTSICQ